MKLSTPSLQDTLKSQETEEWFDLIFYRPAGYRWALFFKKRNVSPNTVTILSILLGAASGVMFYFADLWLNVIGMILLIWANTYDSADGQLARMTGRYSRTGRILDGAAGDFWFVSIYAGICLRIFPAWGFWIWLLAAVTGYFHSRQAAMADYLRNFHLLFVKGKKGSEFDDYSILAERLNSITWKNNCIEKFYLTFYASYTKSQEDRTPELQKLKAVMKERFGDNDIPACFGEEFRLQSRPMMKYTNILSFNTRSFALFISLFAGLPWIYFIFELTVLNILLIYMLHKYENICKRFNLRLRGDD
ncbi:MAG: CDP-alcohol phosphatidyltransferase family protein [Tannerella sp.]|jgi:hypothetical protein|nr:CDP-alcohol phosphatidyltransferase family protein [Tannerella sp.]